ncbi:rubrerythrin family protein [Thermodesulfobacteriota bacterium]
MSESEKNLMAAFAGESQANRKYLAFSKKALDEGHPGVAKLFKAAAQAETVHALNHLEVVGGIKTTAENLKAAFEGEHYEFTEMYPEFLAKSKEEKAGDATKTFHWANEVEKIHGGLYQEALKALEAGEDYPEKDWYVCCRCGYTIADGAPDKCPVCGAKADEFHVAE